MEVIANDPDLKAYPETAGIVRRSFSSLPKATLTLLQFVTMESGTKWHSVGFQRLSNWRLHSKILNIFAIRVCIGLQLLQLPNTCLEGACEIRDVDTGSARAHQGTTYNESLLVEDCSIQDAMAYCY